MLLIRYCTYTQNVTCKCETVQCNWEAKKSVKFRNSENMTEKTIKIDLSIYKQEVITATVHKFTDKCFISQSKADEEIQVTFTAKSEQLVNFELLEKEFENELIDQQIRHATEQKFGHIRNLIVEKAFAPIS